MEKMERTIVAMRWYHWFVAAAALFAIGFGALVVLNETGETATGEDETSLLNSLAWVAWMLSWLGAIISVGMGVVRIWEASRSPMHR